MSDRPSPANGKRNRTWGTREVCPSCGECLCFACHPQGPCVDESATESSVATLAFALGRARREAVTLATPQWGSLGVEGPAMAARR